MTDRELDDTPTVEGTAVELVPTQPGTLFRTDDPVEVVERATRVADSLAAVIQSKGLFTQIQGKSHVRVEGWTLLASMLGVTAVCVETEPVDGGYKATVEARAVDGRVIGRADALCTKHEKRGPWKSADDYARLSMSQTRATSKALKGPLGFVVSLAGYQSTPAEEMTFAEPDAAPITRPPETAPPKRPREGSDIPSEPQLDMIVSLAKKHGADDQDQEMIRAYAAVNLTGGQNGTASKTIELLKGAMPGPVLARLAGKAAEWHGKTYQLSLIHI